MAPTEFGVSRSKVKLIVTFKLRGGINVSQTFLGFFSVYKYLVGFGIFEYSDKIPSPDINSYLLNSLKRRCLNLSISIIDNIFFFYSHKNMKMFLEAY